MILDDLSIVDEYWTQHPELHDVPVYYASSLAKKCMAGNIILERILEIWNVFCVIKEK